MKLLVRPKEGTPVSVLPRLSEPVVTDPTVEATVPAALDHSDTAPISFTDPDCPEKFLIKFRVAPDHSMTQRIKFVNETWSLLNKTKAFLSETDTCFARIGIIGKKNTGKSYLAQLLADYPDVRILIKL